MKLNTEKFGEIEIDESRIFEFVFPIIGFDELKRYIILDPNNKDNLFKWLQSIDEPGLAFPIISVATLNFDYPIDITDNVVEELEIKNAEDLLVMNITSIPQDDPQNTTINLLAPIIFNLDNHLAGQVVLSGSGYDISYPMFKEV